MFHLLLKLLLMGTVAVSALMVLCHVFPLIVGVLVVIGLYKLYQVLRGPKYPPPWR
jgi:hypothetical protein